ncbi:pancreatic secretory granule membrane major glycoprotein GP2-like [Bombina bombina]|uniref:pancreatic secretory granule membrane major glycoprotein GP2-like n=1 Tax=Bombina bombina TaxID=8345 RepID=UPI00235AFA50|nr:pancreatic secretory granule membrane major glycoprotein GP2-like [Bombina bombina]
MARTRLPAMQILSAFVLAALLHHAEALTCTPSCLNDEACVTNAGVSSCICNSTYYKGKTISNLQPSVTCDGKGTITPKFSICLLNYLGYNETTIQLKDHASDNCSSTYTEVDANNVRVQALQVKAQVGQCGNRVTIADSKVTYQNTLRIDILKKLLAAANPIEVNFSCSYNLTMQSSLNVTLNPIVSTTNLPGLYGEGSYPLTLAAFKSPSYTDPFQNGESVNVQTNVYLGFLINGPDGANFTLRVVKCFASPYNARNDNDPNNVPIVEGGCPAPDADFDVAVEQNGVALESRIRFSAFKFQDFDTLNIFCDARLCDKSEGCTGCKAGKASDPSLGAVSLSLNLDGQVNSGSSGTHAAFSATMMISCLLMFVFNKLY